MSTAIEAFYDEYYPGAELHLVRAQTPEELQEKLAYFVQHGRFPVVVASPVGTAEERASGEIWPGEWEDANPYGSAYTLRGQLAYHTGADLNLNSPTWNADKGAPVFACAEGVVTYAGRFNENWGNLVVIRHDGFYSRSAHLARVDVARGDVVALGQQVGTIGGADVNLPDHLHFDISTTEKLATAPGDWPGSDRARLLRDYVDPKAFLAARV